MSRVYEPQWNAPQATDGFGSCSFCGQPRLRRPDPFTDRPACKPCWQAIAYGTNEEGHHHDRD